MSDKKIIKEIKRLLDEEDIFIGYSLNDSSISPYYYTDAKDVHKRKCIIIHYEHYNLSYVLENAIEVVHQKLLGKSKPFDPAANDSIKDMEEEEKAFPSDKE